MKHHTLKLADAPGPQEVIQIELLGQKPIALFNLDGQYYATDDTCTHGDASLAEGDIEGDEIVCPFHLGAFDIRSGEATVPPCATALKVYPISIADGTITIELDHD